MLGEKINTRLKGLIERVVQVQNSVHHGVSHSDMISLPYTEIGDEDGFYQSRAGAIAFMEAVFGRQHSLYQETVSIKNDCGSDNIRRLLGVLRAAQDQIEHGFLQNVQTRAAAEVFTDFIEQAEYLVVNGFKNAAASLAGAVLEDGLRTIATNKPLAPKAGQERQRMVERAYREAASS